MFQSANSNLQVNQEPVVRKQAITAGMIPVFDVDGKMIGTFIPASLLSTAEQQANKGIANGYPSLDASSKIPISQIPAALLGDVNYQGTWNANTNTPVLSSGVGTKGYYYVVSADGATNLNGITDWKLGDWAIFNGTTWNKVDNTDAVISVNGLIGAVDLTYNEASTIIALPPSGIWTTVAIPGAPGNKEVDITFNCTSGSGRTVGARAVGSLLNRAQLIGLNVSYNFRVRTNSLGQVQLFVSNASALSIIYYGYRN